jgi:hypothetical protein
LSSTNEQEVVEKIESEQQPVDISQARKVSKIDMKRSAALQERRQRLINKGTDPAKVDQIIAQQDWEEMPLDKKVKRLEGIISSSMQQIAHDIRSLQMNDKILADAMDLNFTSISKALEKLGLDKDLQSSILHEAEKEMLEARKAAEQERLKASQFEAAKFRKEEEALLAQAELQKSENKKTDEDSAGALVIPDGATTFGG